MTSVDVILAALAAGAGAGASAATEAAVVDAYAGLRNTLRRRLVGRSRALQVLDTDEADPGVWRTRIGDDLVDSGADRDEAVLDAARRLLELSDSDRARTGRYIVDARKAKGVQLGEGNIQHNTY